GCHLRANEIRPNGPPGELPSGPWEDAGNIAPLRGRGTVFGSKVKRERGFWGFDPPARRALPESPLSRFTFHLSRVYDHLSECDPSSSPSSSPAALRHQPPSRPPWRTPPSR